MRLLIALSLVFTLILASCGADTTTIKENDFSPLTQIIITADYPAIANKTSNQFTATGNFSDLFTKDITTDVVWTSSNPGILTIDSSGLALAVTSGEVQISASMDDVAEIFYLTVTDATISRIELLPVLPTVSKGLTQQFQANGIFSDATEQSLAKTVTWTSLNPEIATIDSAGVASALEEGVTNITAAFDGVTKTTTMTVIEAELVSIEISPSLAVDIPQRVNVKYIATGLFSDNTLRSITTQVSWTSSNTTVASIDASGIAVGAAAGTTQLTATLNSISAVASLSITADKLVEIIIDPAAPVVAQGKTISLKAAGILDNLTQIDITKGVIWQTNNNNVSISSSAPTEGIATGLIPGTTQVTATSGTINSAAVTLTVQ